MESAVKKEKDKLKKRYQSSHEGNAEDMLVKYLSSSLRLAIANNHKAYGFYAKRCKAKSDILPPIDMSLVLAVLLQHPLPKSKLQTLHLRRLNHDTFSITLDLGEVGLQMLDLASYYISHLIDLTFEAESDCQETRGPSELPGRQGW